jgi:hypothetical protein
MRGEDAALFRCITNPPTTLQHDFKGLGRQGFRGTGQVNGLNTDPLPRLSICSPLSAIPRRVFGNADHSGADRTSDRAEEERE